MTEVKHADLIRAVLDGKTVQFREGPRDDWDEYGHPWAIPQMILHPEWEWRLRPETLVWFMGITLPHKTVTPYATNRDDVLNFGNGAMELAKILRLELDPDNLSVISARTEAP
jgi:hypothetical protein